MTATTGARSAFHIAYPNLTDLRDQQRNHGSYRLPFRLACLGLLLYLLISDNLLVSIGIPYNTPSGSFLFKQHPGTYLIALGFFLLILQGNPRDHWKRLFASAAAPLLLTGVVLSVLMYTVIRFGPSGNAYFIDTLLMPALLATVLLQAPLESQRFVFRMVMAILVFNAILGIVEAIIEVRLIPYLIDGQPAIEDYFRATALGGHPLRNSIRTATLLAACLMLPLGLRLVLIPLLLIALLAFGSRLALAISLLLLGIWGFYHYFKNIIKKTFDLRLVFGLVLISLIIVVGIVTLATTSGLGQRIFLNFFWDNSAHHRILVFNALDYLKLQDWLWGIGHAGQSWIFERLSTSTTMSGFENFWVLFIVQIGLAWTIPLSFALLWMIASLTRESPYSLKLAAVIFLVLVSSNNSLATKSQELAILVAILIGGRAEAAILREHQR